MDEKYMQAIKAGVIGGVIMAIVTVITHFVPFTGCLLFWVGWVVALAVGVLAIYFGPKLVKTIMDAVVMSAVAGGVAGGINGIVILLLALLGAAGAGIDGSVVGAGVGLMAGIIGLVVSIISAVILAVIAGLLYTIVVLKINK